MNGLALAALPTLLERTDLPGWQRGIATLRHDLAGLWQARGFVVRESAANWVLVHDAAHLRIPLARCGVLVRDCGSFGLEGVIRVAVPGPDDLCRVERVLAALER